MRKARRDTDPRVSQADLSARVEAYGVRLNRASVSKIELGDRTVTDFELRALAAALAVSVGWLVNEEGIHSAKPISRPSRRPAPVRG
jgi:hypothetical protein